MIEITSDWYFYVNLAHLALAGVGFSFNLIADALRGSYVNPALDEEFDWDDFFAKAPHWYD